MYMCLAEKAKVSQTVETRTSQNSPEGIGMKINKSDCCAGSQDLLVDQLQAERTFLEVSSISLHTA